MTDRELMQQALDLLDDINQCSLPPVGIPLPAEIDHVMEALRNRLEKWTVKDMAYRPGGLSQLEPKPVAWVRNLTDPQPHCVTDLKYMSAADVNAGVQYVPLYAAPEHSEQWWKHEVSNAYAEGYEKGRVFCGCGDQIMANDGAECGNCVTARNAVKNKWKWLTEEEIDKIANSASSKLSAVFLAESQLRGKNAL